MAAGAREAQYELSVVPRRDVGFKLQLERMLQWAEDDKMLAHYSSTKHELKLTCKSEQQAEAFVVQFFNQIQNAILTTTRTLV